MLTEVFKVGQVINKIRYRLRLSKTIILLIFTYCLSLNGALAQTNLDLSIGKEIFTWEKNNIPNSNGTNNGSIGDLQQKIDSISLLSLSARISVDGNSLFEVSRTESSGGVTTGSRVFSGYKEDAVLTQQIKFYLGIFNKMLQEESLLLNNILENTKTRYTKSTYNGEFINTAKTFSGDALSIVYTDLSGNVSNLDENEKFGFSIDYSDLEIGYEFGMYEIGIYKSKWNAPRGVDRYISYDSNGIRDIFDWITPYAWDHIPRYYEAEFKTQGWYFSIGYYNHEEPGLFGLLKLKTGTKSSVTESIDIVHVDTVVETEKFTIETDYLAFTFGIGYTIKLLRNLNLTLVAITTNSSFAYKGWSKSVLEDAAEGWGNYGVTLSYKF
jgi:hypothetical protein